MNQYNITAQVYSKFDKDKQTLLMNEIVSAPSDEDAIETFKDIYQVDHEIVRIFSAETV